MNDVYDFLARAVIVIKEDHSLKECFDRILEDGSSTQQVRVAALLKELEKLNAPDDVKKFVKLLGDDKLAHQVLKHINS